MCVYLWLECMVSHIHATVEDELGERVRAVKEENDWTWAEFFQNTAEAFEEGDE